MFSSKDFKDNDIQTSIVIMGLNDPSYHFKTVQFGLEKYSQTITD